MSRLPFTLPEKKFAIENVVRGPRILLAVTLCSCGVFLALYGFAASLPSRTAEVDAKRALRLDLVSVKRAPAVTEQQVHGSYRGMPVTYVVKDGKAIFQGDIILEKVDSINAQYQLPSSKVDSSNIDSISIAYAQYRWPKVGNQYQIPYVIAAGSGNLTGVANAQYITIGLTNVQDSAGNIGNVTSPQMGVLVGDTNADGFTDAIDVSQTKSQSGNAVTNANFREDVNVDTFIDAIDVSLVKSKSGTALPSSP